MGTLCLELMKEFQTSFLTEISLCYEIFIQVLLTLQRIYLNSHQIIGYICKYEPIFVSICLTEIWKQLMEFDPVDRITFLRV